MLSELAHSHSHSHSHSTLSQLNLSCPPTLTSNLRQEPERLEDTALKNLALTWSKLLYSTLLSSYSYSDSYSYSGQIRSEGENPLPQISPFPFSSYSPFLPSQHLQDTLSLPFLFHSLLPFFSLPLPFFREIVTTPVRSSLPGKSWVRPTRHLFPPPFGARNNSGEEDQVLQ